MEQASKFFFVRSGRLRSGYGTIEVTCYSCGCRKRTPNRDSSGNAKKNFVPVWYVFSSKMFMISILFSPAVSFSMAFLKTFIDIVEHECSALGDKVGLCSYTLTTYWLVQ